MKDYTSTNAVCPYYRHETNRQIFCEGITDTSHLTLNFDDTEEKRNHRKHFCYNFNFSHCPISKMLYKEWEKYDE